MRKIIISGNWKMNKYKEEALKFIYQINNKLPDRKIVETIIFPQTILLDVLTQIEGKNLRIGAQNIFYKNEGSYTGETSPLNLHFLGIKYSLIGHCERRKLFGETDKIVNLKLLALLKLNIYPIVCIGEDIVAKEENWTESFLDIQLKKIFLNVPKENINKIILAYEPFWAIGTGKSVQPEVANEIIFNIRKKISSLFSEEDAQKIRIIYGGSINTNNVEVFLRQKEIDGILAGNSSLNMEDFLFFTQVALKISQNK
ncbi:MAG: triose-phosphate isomerase [Candidatus Phytoplasma stylosanthis]|uniref:triose-phosphate isomerase n=1 Tax=Candidatus Phytoplasma stylosanthis TaxID=2798314 RepID=UPI00293A5E0D|nr:triose-phosphate isomerase [Candidatus Phytoplasma stylosanthis]MDV3167765.1 triose-phosphate isomerase [Candidatus Phytoplasma stylosanthis]MDV3170958.1 triose-phosphate isomerase [Candidatus Phytoplasma stylosanthis]MDV3173635.1 triose-phosphate isomerase [Candidatus Phytoplasma stylosanthis]MDV3174130.1 triose-phosphate isomerase [Candidatus Phytoplasma stylosanthis]MDV3202351.1 triose-phosphate isomerase [Candidatus Phytoplasma stylosanthis]